MERLQKVIAYAGVASRRKAEQLIVEGKVKVNGVVVRELGTKVSNADTIEVEGIKLEKEDKVYYLLYKPRGTISSGLLLLTNDGEFSYMLTHPKFKIDKTYIARVKGVPTIEGLKKLQRGIKLEDGETAPAKVSMTSFDEKAGKAICEITIHEGRNRQVRRMFEAIGTPVVKLKRERFAFLDLYGLAPGEYRELTKHEVKQLRVLAETGKLD